VDSDDTSTRLLPMFTDVATASIRSGDIPTSSAMSFTVGKNVGITTPDVLLNTEIRPVTPAIHPVKVEGVAQLANRLLNNFRPPVFSHSVTSTVMPQTINTTLHAIS